VILEIHACPARARLREAQLIAEHQPVTNYHHKNGPNKQVLEGFTKRGARCCCGAADCYGQEALNQPIKPTYSVNREQDGVKPLAPRR
jgi:hypothetical protein